MRLVLAIALVFSGSQCIAQVCDRVLTEKAYNSSDSESSSSVYSDVMREMCTESWSDSASFNTAAGKLGIDAAYASYTFGLRQANSRRAGSYSAAYDKYCSVGSERFISEESQRLSMVDTNYALQVWQDCVQSTSNGLFAFVTEGPNFDFFDVQLIHRTDGNSNFEIRSLSEEEGVMCKVGNVDLAPTPDNPYPVETAVSTFRCQKPAERSVQLSFNTSEGAPIPIQVNGTALSQSQIQERLDAHEEQLLAMRSEVETQLANLREGMSSIRLTNYVGAAVVAERVNDAQWRVDGYCGEGEQVIDYFCSIQAGAGQIQNIGNTGNSFHCLWTNTSPDFAGRGTPVCMKLEK